MAIHKHLFALHSLLAGLLLVAADAQADGMSCKDRLVSTGDSTYQVRSVCGEPDEARQRVEVRTIRRRVNVPCASGQRVCFITVEDSVQVVIDEWMYDFGRQRFIQYLRFEQNQLTNVETGSYGHKL